MLTVNHLAGFGVGSSPPPTTSYANTGGTGDRTATIAVTTNATVTGGTIDNFVDGSTTTTSPNAVDFGSATINIGDYAFRVDFNGTGAKRYIDEFRVNTDSTAFNYGTWEFQGSNDAGSWTALASFTWSTTAWQTVTCSTPPPNDGYRYYQLIKVTASSTWGAKWHTEVEFKIAAGV